MTYNALKKIIEAGRYEAEDIKRKLDIFLLGDRITPEQYEELTKMVAGESPERPNEAD